MGVNNAARKNLSGFLTVALMAALLLAPSIGYAQQVNLVFRQSDPEMGDVATTDTLWQSHPTMPRLARLDAPGVLHHVMVRGLERRAIFRDDADRTDFVDRLAALAEVGAHGVRVGAAPQFKSISWSAPAAVA